MATTEKTRELRTGKTYHDDLAIVREELDKCMKCGKCIDNCPKGAISYHIKGTDIPEKRNTYRLLFLFAAFLFLAIFSSHTIQSGIIRILKLITTGSMIS